MTSRGVHKQSRYAVAKEIFLDSAALEDYIELDTSVEAYNQMLSSLTKPIKMILLFGRPGTGKTIFLNYLYETQKENNKMYLFDIPPVESDTLFKSFFSKLKKNKERYSGFDSLVALCKKQTEQIVVLLDEAQLYNDSLLEKIRLIADTRAIKFVVSLHKTENEDLIAKEHFTSRIWETIELKGVSYEELVTYIQKKFIQKNAHDIAKSFTPKTFKLIHKFTKGNYRECNKLIYTILEICQYYDENQPSKIDYNRMSVKLVQMAAIKLGYIRV